VPLQFTTTGAVAVTLSNGNKTATSTAASGFGAGAYLNEVVAGKCCFAMRFDGLADGGNIVELIAAATGLDFANYSIVGTYISEFTNASLANSNGSPSGATLSGAAPIVNGDVIFVCIDEPNNLIWVYKNGTIVSGAGNPAAGTGGLSGFLISGARTPAAALSSAGAAMTVIDDPVAAGITVPSGFTYLGYSPAPTNPPSNTSAPTLSDTTPVVGQVITAGSDTWTESPTSFGVQFYCDGAPVGSRSSTRTYTVQAADAGKALSVGVIATNAIGDSAEAFSTSSSAIAHTWQLVGVAVSAVNASGNYTLTLPSGSQSGDVVVAAIAMRSNVGFTVPAGWTQANQDTGGNTTNNTTASDTSSLQAYIIRGGSAPSMVFTRTGGSRALGVVAVYRYTDQSAPPTFDTSVLTPLGAAATAISGTGLTTGAAGELIVGAVFGARNITVSNFRATNPATGSGSTDTTANPADGAWTERADSLNGTSPTVGIFLADAVRTSAGATGSLLATASASALHAIGAMAFAPPTGGGTITSASARSAGASSASGLGAATNAQRAVSAAASAAVGRSASVAASDAQSQAGAQALAQGAAILSAVAQSSSASVASATGAQVAASAGQSTSASSALGDGASTVAAAALSAAASSARAGQASLAATAAVSISGAVASGSGASTATSQAFSSGSSRAEGRGASLAAFQASSISVSSTHASTSPVILVSAAGSSSGASAAQAASALIAARVGQSLAVAAAGGRSTAIAARDAGSASAAMVAAQASAIAQAAAASLAVSAVAGQWSALARADGFAQSVALGWAGQGAIVSVAARADGVALTSGYGRAIVFSVDTPASRTFLVAPENRLAVTVLQERTVSTRLETRLSVPPLQSRTVQAAPQGRTITARG